MKREIEDAIAWAMIVVAIVVGVLLIWNGANARTERALDILDAAEAR
jgi:cytochrome c-type biogenesis protein CcmH/NrfF